MVIVVGKWVKWCDASTEFKPNQSIRIFDDMGELVIDEGDESRDILYIPAPYGALWRG